MGRTAFIVCTFLFFAAVACKKFMPGTPQSGEIVAEPIAGLSSAQMNKHLLGDAAFAKVYTPEDGLGPIFIQSSCEGCHIGDGKGHPINVVTRFGKTGPNGFDYMSGEGGAQLQPRAINGFQGEILPGSHMFRTDRLPPLVTGLGFLAAIHDSTILNLTDSLDIDGDGVKGTVNYIEPEPYTIYNSDVTFDLKNKKIKYHHDRSEDWKITIINTGEETKTGGRLKRIKNYINDKIFCFTYGDAVANINIKKLIEQHNKSNCIATVTAVQPSGRFGQLTLNDDGKVSSFIEKPVGDGGWINGGFFVLSSKVFDYIDNDSSSWEEEPLQKLSNEGNLSFYKHNDYWQCMDTLRDWHNLQKKWNNGNPPWKIW